MDLGQRGIRCVAVAKHNEAAGGWYMLGLITFLDPPRPDTKQVQCEHVLCLCVGLISDRVQLVLPGVWCLCVCLSLCVLVYV